ncbi:MAG: sialate O-acetylesterase [Candidatus Ratteibacteria bacterium]|nr:sialate O-acetylesterase [Candidatus Ratteibacteria bacterium]
MVSQVAFCQVRLPRLISDGMVLQRDTNVKIWGWANAGEKITVNFNGKTYKTAAGKDGRWEVKLPQLKAGGPYTMEIKASNNITLKDILVGDVWVCSGQSNMDLTMNRVKDRYPDVIANSENPLIRRFLVPMVYDFKTPQQDVQSGSWEYASPKSVLNFTATGYFFAKALYEKYRVPIGLIHASVGGSPAESWLSEDALKAFPEYFKTAQQLKEDNYIKSVMDEEQSAMNSWYRNVYGLDEGWSKNEKWFDANHDASDWDWMNLPTYFKNEKIGRINGVVWFRKEINVPASMIGKPARIELGAIIDSDHVYINGKLVGTTSYQYPPRKYDVPSDLLKEGKNIIVVRVISNAGEGGFVKGKPYELTAGGQTIDLKGEWKYKVGAVVDSALPGTTFFQYKPLGLYNGMIAPLLNYTIKGVIWYQGESNTGKPLEYRQIFPALIANWRQKWGEGNFPFLYVQLANFMGAKDQPSESNWAALREAQLKTLSVPNTGMAVAIDIGEANDLHPTNKEDVGKRLALAAQKVAYGDKTVVYSGPIYKSMEVKGNKIIISFANIGSGLVAKGGELKQFAIAGADKKFVWATAKIDGDKVVVWNDQVQNPVAVRYAWADNPEGANLYNREGLPASPFRTDDK